MLTTSNDERVTPTALSGVQSAPIQDQGLVVDATRPSTNSSAAVMRANLRKKWIDKQALLITNDGSAYQAKSIHFKKDDGWIVKATKVGGSVLLKPFNINKIESDNETEVTQIILNFFGGTFADGDRAVRVIDIDISSPTIPRVDYGILDGGTISEANSESMELHEFVATFCSDKEQVQAEGGQQPSGGFDLSIYPATLRALIAASVVEHSDSTTLPPGEARQVLLSIGAQDDLAEFEGVEGLSKLAAMVEDRLTAPTASPNMSRLRAAVEATQGADRDLTARGRLIRQMVLPTGEDQVAQPMAVDGAVSLVPDFDMRPYPSVLRVHCFAQRTLSRTQR